MLCHFFLLNSGEVTLEISRGRIQKFKIENCKILKHNNISTKFFIIDDNDTRAQIIFI